ncbi:MAG: hypothetical protein ABEJ07_03555 [Candidatus Nanohaloarchaea archaeon]
MFSLIKDILGSGGKLPVTLSDCRTVNNWSTRFSEGDTKVCSTDVSDKPRYVITDSHQERYAVYTESLSSCLGVLLFEESGQKAVAGLAHVMPTESGLVSTMIKELDADYRPSRLNAVIAVGDDPDPGTFENTVKLMLRAGNISKNRLKVVYGGPGKPYFMNQKGRGMTASKIAYDTRRHDLNIGKD